MNKESIIIGIAGGSGSGKSTFTNRIKERFGDKVVVIYHDNYYRRQDGIPFEKRVKVCLLYTSMIISFQKLFQFPDNFFHTFLVVVFLYIWEDIL